MDTWITITENVCDWCDMPSNNEGLCDECRELDEKEDYQAYLAEQEAIKNDPILAAVL